MGNLFNKVDKEIVIDNFNEIKEIIIEQINQLLYSKIKIINFVEDSYNSCLFRNENDIYLWKIRIIEYINYIYEGQDKEIEKILINKGIIQGVKNKKKSQEVQDAIAATPEPSKEGKIKKFLFLTSKDIQIKLLELTREFESYLGKYISDDEQNEKLLAINLLNIANLSRYSYNQSNNFLKNLFKEYEKQNKNVEIILSSPDEIKVQFYCWLKNDKNQVKIKTIKEKFISTIPEGVLKNITEQKDINYMFQLFVNMFELFFESQLSFPQVEIIFLKEEVNYESKRMIDYFDSRIKGVKKVNFEYFPAFYSNGNFLENGRHWVFTYRGNNNFNLKNNQLLKLENSFLFPKLGDLIKFEVVETKYLMPKSNYKIREGVHYEYKYFLTNKKSGKTIEKKSNTFVQIDENEKFVKCDFMLMNKFILSFPSSK